MDKNSFNNNLEKIFKNKKMAPLIILLLILLLIYFALSYFIDVNNISKDKNSNKQTSTVGTSTNEDEQLTKEDYEIKQTKELETILGKINGVGKVKAMISFEGSEEKIPAVDSTTQSNNIEESDSSGGKKVTKQETGGEKVVVTSGSKGDDPLILKTEKPKVVGVMIVADGAEQERIKYDITKAVASLYNISLDKVSVFPMEGN